MPFLLYHLDRFQSLILLHHLYRFSPRIACSLPAETDSCRVGYEIC